MKIVIPDKIDLTVEHIKELKTLGDITIYDDVPNEKEIIKRITGAEVITANYIDFTSKAMESTPTLKYIIVPAVGYEWVDIKTATAKGIKVLNCPTQNSDAVANFTIALIFAVTRRLIEANKALKKGEWQPGKYEGIELTGKTLGIIGYGHIGQRVSQFAEALGMKAQYVNSKSPNDELDKLIASADILSLHAPLTDSTRHILNERRLNLMKKGAYLVNTARGAEIDQKALIQMLESGHLAGAALDVFEGESLTGKPSEEIIKLANMSNVIATPHMAYNTEETKFRLGKELIENVKSCLINNPVNVVN